MSVNIEKTVSITIDGEDVGILRDVCECARIYLDALTVAGDLYTPSRRTTYKGRDTELLRILIDKVLNA
jgi:hypothetical protein